MGNKFNIQGRAKMSWQEIAPIIKNVWEENAETDKGSCYKGSIKQALKRKKLFLKSAEKFGTPQYILDEAVLKEKALSFKKTFEKYIPCSEFFYAIKSNDLPYIAKRLKSLGYNADVAGLFELKLALRLGFRKIIFTGPGKRAEELKLAIKNKGKVIINIDNTDELDDIIGLLKKDKSKTKLRVSIRINPDSAVMKAWSKFGVDLKDLKKTMKKAKSNEKIRLAGLHFHSSWNETPKRYCKNIKLIGDYLKNNFNKKDLADLEFLDLGGGIFPESQATLNKFSHKSMLAEIIEDLTGKKIPFDKTGFIMDNADSLEKFGKSISKQLKKYIFNLNKSLKIYFEPGRYVSNNSTHILLKVIAEKNSNVIADGGMNLIGGLDFSEYLFAPVINLSNPSFKLKKKIIYGSLCKADDLWGYSFFGKNCKKNDILAVLMQGSYTFSRAWRLIKENAPYVVINEKNRLILAKEKERFEERYSGCKF